MVSLLSSSHLCKGTFVLNLTQTEGATVFPIFVFKFVLLVVIDVFFICLQLWPVLYDNFSTSSRETLRNSLLPTG